jgi:hypothetical protein
MDAAELRNIILSDNRRVLRTRDGRYYMFPLNQFYKMVEATDA